MWYEIDKDVEMPEPYQEVIAGNIYDDWVTICIRKKTHWYNANDFDNGNAIPVFPTHWMPKPKLPKK